MDPLQCPRHAAASSRTTTRLTGFMPEPPPLSELTTPVRPVLMWAFMQEYSLARRVEHGACLPYLSLHAREARLARFSLAMPLTSRHLTVLYVPLCYGIV